MRFSAIVFILVHAIFVAPLTGTAQPRNAIPRIGILTPNYNPHSPFEAFRQGLRDLGYVDGQSIAMEYRFAEGKVERLPELAAELVRLKVDVIVADAGVAARAAQHATETIPIVCTAFFDPVGQGFIASLARPGGNITGLSFGDPALMGKRLELLKEVVPGVTRVGYLWHAAPITARSLQETERAARALGLQLHPVEVREPYPFDQAFATMAEAHVDALLMQPSGQFLTHRTEIVDLAVQKRLPVIFDVREFAEAGGLMAYGNSIPAVFYRLATYVDKILKGVKPAELPVEQAMKFELVINLKTAKALGLTIPPTLLFQADEVIR
jgi:putative ABC transport system substrate-binding protein